MRRQKEPRLPVGGGECVTNAGNGGLGAGVEVRESGDIVRESRGSCCAFDVAPATIAFGPLKCMKAEHIQIAVEPACADSQAMQQRGESKCKDEHKNRFDLSGYQGNSCRRKREYVEDERDQTWPTVSKCVLQPGGHRRL